MDLSPDPRITLVTEWRDADDTPVGRVDQPGTAAVEFSAVGFGCKLRLDDDAVFLSSDGQVSSGPQRVPEDSGRNQVRVEPPVQAPALVAALITLGPGCRALAPLCPAHGARPPIHVIPAP